MGKIIHCVAIVPAGVVEVPVPIAGEICVCQVEGISCRIIVAVSVGGGICSSRRRGGGRGVKGAAGKEFR